MYSEGVEDQNYLRGAQIADDDGIVRFTSIFPSCYPGRWPHIHFQVYPHRESISDSRSAIATSQVALPKAICDKVYATTGYEQSVNSPSRSPWPATTSSVTTAEQASSPPPPEILTTATRSSSPYAIDNIHQTQWRRRPRSRAAEVPLRVASRGTALRSPRAEPQVVEQQTPTDGVRPSALGCRNRF